MFFFAPSDFKWFAVFPLGLAVSGALERIWEVLSFVLQDKYIKKKIKSLTVEEIELLDQVRQDNSIVITHDKKDSLKYKMLRSLEERDFLTCKVIPIQRNTNHYQFWLKPREMIALKSFLNNAKAD